MKPVDILNKMFKCFKLPAIVFTMASPSLAFAQTAGEDIRDIKGLEHFSYSPIYYIIPALLLLALLYFAWRLYKKRRARINVDTISPPPPDEVALRKLGILMSDGQFEKLGEKLFNFRLSEIFRDYLEGRYEFQASDMTTEEIISLLQRRKVASNIQNLASENIAIINELLTKTDKVKFAKSRPGKNIALGLIDNCIQFVKETCCHCEEQSDEAISR